MQIHNNQSKRLKTAFPPAGTLPRN
uniref:Uncharacterized protein n=1 Tax=Anguilla anguilla TaxID=7936 RepID=A0A0E9VWQ8_ANGAN